MSSSGPCLYDSRSILLRPWLVRVQAGMTAAIKIGIFMFLSPSGVVLSSEISPETSLIQTETTESSGDNDVSVGYAQAMSFRDDIMGQASFYRARIEFRRSLLAGLGWMFEFTPEVERRSALEQERLAMQRQTWSWSFETDLKDATDGVLSDLIIQPRLGLLNLDYLVSTTSSTGRPEIIRFETMDNLAIGLRVGINLKYASIGHELSGSYDRTTLGAGGSRDASVVSQKLGYSLSYVLQQQRQVKINLVAFGDGERLVMNRDPLNVLSDTAVGLYEVSFRMIHIGGGVGLAW